MTGCPTLRDLPPPPLGRFGWPWTEESAQLPEAMPDGSPWPRISIVTPSYNQCRFIEETIRSVLLQGYRNLEYIVIDGGSTDESVEIIRKYAPWLAYWVSEKDEGQSHAINKGFELATGDIVAWLNSDDVYSPSLLQARADYFAGHSDTDIVYGDLDEIDEKSSTIKRIKSQPFSLSGLAIIDYIAQPSAFWRRGLLSRIGFLRADLHFVMDYEYWLRAALNGAQIERVDGPSARYRYYPDTKTCREGRKSWIEILGIKEKYFAQPESIPGFPAVADKLRIKTLWNATVGADLMALSPTDFDIRLRTLSDDSAVYSEIRAHVRRLFYKRRILMSAQTSSRAMTLNAVWGALIRCPGALVSRSVCFSILKALGISQECRLPYL